MSQIENTRSNAWFLVPIIFGLLGGIIAFFILRGDDPSKAKNCLYVGIAIMVITVAASVAMGSVFPDILFESINNV